MQVYGDRSRLVEPRAKLSEVEAGLQEVLATEAGVARHARLVAAFLAAADLAQGVADAEFEDRGRDDASPARDAAMALCRRLARMVGGSWQSGFKALGAQPSTELGALAALPLPELVRTKPAEGHAFYAVYPEAYLEAARNSGLVDARVVGLRSIGAGVAAMVAEGLGAASPLTVRPVGEPFRRRLSLAPSFEQALTGAAHNYAIVDEGPGLSGSSMAAVGHLLERRGAVSSMIHLFPSHAGDPGPAAGDEVRRGWRRWTRHVVDFDTLALHVAHPARRLEAWAADLIGPAIGPLEDISGGAWRARAWPDRAAWPPVFAGQERRKFLMLTASGPWLLKFAGLGMEGERKLALGRALAEAGFAPEVAGLAHGFIVQRWVEETRPLDPRRCDRAALVAHVGRYVAFRARRFPAADAPGASVHALWSMARRNIAEAGGDLADIEAWAPRLDSLARCVRPVEIDGRLHGWEWLQLADGRLLKADALDHAGSHDMIGRQDIAWDIAGAEVELELTPAERRALVDRVRQDAPVDEGAVTFMGLCYRAFQLGRSTLAASCAEPEEAARLTRDRARYLAGLQAARAA